MKTAFITGIGGQDGAFLAQLLIKKGYVVYGGYRRKSDSGFWRLDFLKIKDKIKFVEFELTEYAQVIDVINKLQVDEFYNLAAQSFVEYSFQDPVFTMNVNAIAVNYICEGIKRFSPHTKFYQAGTSEMFGKVQETPQNESTPFYPRSPYGISKLAAYWTVKNYRESYNLFFSNGILFNHESELRGAEFVTQKIVNWITKEFSKKPISEIKPLELGNIDSKRDWGYAKDYVKGMWKMLQSDFPDDYVLATGKTYSVREFVEECFTYIDKTIIWQGNGVHERGFVDGDCVVKINPNFYRPAEVDLLIGDSKKAWNDLGWQSEHDLSEIIEIMIDVGLR